MLMELVMPEKTAVYEKEYSQKISLMLKIRVNTGDRIILYLPLILTEFFHKGISFPHQSNKKSPVQAIHA